MLGGIQPILIFHSLKRLPTTTELSNIPLQAAAKSLATFAIIPIYLDAALTGIHIDTEEKNIDIETVATGMTDGGSPLIAQKPISSVTSINLEANKESIGLTLMAAFAEYLVDKVTSEEYEITYINGPVTVFAGLLHGFHVSQSSQNDKMLVKIDISKGRKNKALEVQNTANVRLPSTGTLPPTTATPLTTTTAPTNAIAPQPSSPVRLRGLN